MHTKYQTKQSDECLICFQPLLKEVSFVHLMRHVPICPSCMNKFEMIDKHIDFHHYPLWIPYYYNSFFKTLLFQYKGLYDQALKDAILSPIMPCLVHKYQNHIIVVAPSSKEDNEKRGFSPIETIAKTFSSHVFTGLYKREKYKQSDLSYEERKNVSSKIGIRNGEELKDKKVLILDDVVTSGSTLYTCLKLVLEYQPKSVELLVLSTKNDAFL